ncbi:PleD family two-component system response regulator [Paremcibacter congregatus]|uniref:diguanylate cyclase n=1 Tax=Paremcibacter congregatus TaxID=2043170 RepID=A0A2G4YMW3_9PROT|nr:PleD family two-component system response regulator [Paremcibacter congregatus]PHZ83648.1 PleD family two-component system response regulator [Paremcibacter congregatus]QDE27351.1 PleD family two-component system response regulator [Paremcibacter congregatus]
MTARVLVVDDVIQNVKLLEAKLTSEYFDVLTAMNGEDALAIIEQENPDIVLLDVMMPGMDGFEVCRRIRANVKSAHIPVIMVTALDQPKDRVAGLEAGADDFLTKPVLDLPLFARVRSLVRLKVLMDELRMREATGQDLGIKIGPDLSRNISLSNAKVLLVEDYIRVAGRIQSYLEDIATVTVDNVESGEITTPSLEKFDLIIISLSLSEIDGLRLCSHLRSAEATRQIPILVLVDEGDTQQLVRAMELGVTDYIARPIDRNELVARSKAQIRQKRYANRLRRNMQKSIEMAMTDAVTGLYNRHFLSSHLDNMMSKENDKRKKVSLLMMDLDKFKIVNDTYGHASGDEVLHEFARRISNDIRNIDLAARFGGEEFVVVMPETNLEYAHFVAERLRRSIADEPFEISGSETPIDITVSIGLAISGDNNTSSSKLLVAADQALYKAKENGRNQVCSQD